jgi:hypothetical protein
MREGEVCSTHGRVGKRPLWKPDYSWEETIKMDLKDIVCEDVDWIHLVQHMVQ